jgi:hypothetical protein
MKVVHHASLSKAGNDRALAVMDELLEVLSHLETDTEVEETCGTSGGDGIHVCNVLMYIFNILFIIIH